MRVAITIEICCGSLSSFNSLWGCIGYIRCFSSLFLILWRVPDLPFEHTYMHSDLFFWLIFPLHILRIARFIGSKREAWKDGGMVDRCKISSVGLYVITMSLLARYTFRSAG